MKFGTQIAYTVPNDVGGCPSQSAQVPGFRGIFSFKRVHDLGYRVISMLCQKGLTKQGHEQLST